MAQRQLNIRSNDAYERAHRLAAQRKTSLTAVIEQALVTYEAKTSGIGTGFAPDMVQEKKRRLRDALRKAWGPDGPPRGPSSDHSWLYDDNGLPK